MKSDQEFLSGVWQKVRILENEELQKARVKELNRKYTIKIISISALSMLTFTILLMASKFLSSAVYPITISILFIAFVYETVSNKGLEDKRHAN